MLVRQADDTWIASTGGFILQTKVQANELDFALPGNRGQFRGALDQSSGLLRGHWIQPAGDVLGAYTFPVLLRPSGAHQWRGNVQPLEQRYSVYAIISEPTPGKLVANIVNPESNYPRGTFEISVTGSELHFAGRISINSMYDPHSGVITLRIPGITTPLLLSRRTREDAVGLYPRTPKETSPYVYRTPLPADDG